MLNSLPAVAAPIFTTDSGYSYQNPRAPCFTVLTRKGSFRMSVQAGEGLYSDPRQNGLTLDQYSEVEIALLGRPRKPGGRSFLRPRNFGIKGFDDLISEYDEVGGYISADRVVAFVNHCAKHHHVVGNNSPLGNKARKAR